VAVDESVFKVFMEWRPLSPVVHFERPAAEFAESFAAMRDAFMAIGDNRWQRFMAIAHRDPFAYAEMQRDRSEGKSLPDGFVRTDVFWIVLEDVVVGECHVRHILTPEPENIGGNIGYQVHPEYRNRGIATFALREALGVTARIGMREALITCAPDNGASIRVIEMCGGRRIEDSAPALSCSYLRRTILRLYRHGDVTEDPYRLKSLSGPDTRPVVIRHWLTSPLPSLKPESNASIQPSSELKASASKQLRST
jgi:predicted acetyltransferase